jgi:hypothetical protein
MWLTMRRPRPSQVHALAARLGVRPVDVVGWNAGRFPGLNSNSKLLTGSEVFVRDPALSDVVEVQATMHCTA